MKILQIVSGVLFFAAFAPYILTIVKGETRPSKASWIIWVTLDSITFAGMLCQGALNGQMIGAIAGGWIIVVLAMRYGQSGWTKLDKFCLSGAVLGIALWATFNSPLVGMLTSLSVILIGAFPTFKSAWDNPAGEDKTAWTLWTLSCVCALIAIPQWTLADASQPIVFTIVEATVCAIIYLKPRKR